MHNISEVSETANHQLNNSQILLNNNASLPNSPFSTPRLENKNYQRKIALSTSDKNLLNGESYTSELSENFGTEEAGTEDLTFPEPPSDLLSGSQKLGPSRTSSQTQSHNSTPKLETGAKISQNKKLQHTNYQFESPLDITLCLADMLYKHKRKNVFKIISNDGSEYLFQVSNFFI